MTKRERIHKHRIEQKLSSTHALYYTRSMSRSSRSSRYDARSESSTYISKENKESSLLDQVLSLRDTIAHSLGFSYSDEETEASSSMNTYEVEEDSRNDDVSDEATLRYEMSKKSKQEKIERRVDPDDNYLQQNLRNIYKKKQENCVSTKEENDDSSLDLSLAESDDDSSVTDRSSVYTSNSFESEIRLRNYYTHSECPSFEEKPPMSCRKPESVLKKAQNKLNKKKSFHRNKKSASVVEVPVEEENKRVKWMDQIAADFDPYLFEMRREYAKNMCNVRLAMDEHSLIMEKIMKVNTIGLCGELAEM